MRRMPRRHDCRTGVCNGSDPFLETNTSKALTIAEKNEQALKDAAKEMDKLRKQVKELQTAQEKTTKTVEEASQKQKTNLTKVQQIQLTQSENVNICRNIKPITKNKTESYEELEAAFSRAVREILSHDVKVAHVKRLQKVKGDTSRGPSTMRVELANRGDKIKIFRAVEQMVKNQAQFDYTFTNEIPQYALNAYKHLNKVALVVRQSHKGVKTRVTINPGDHWPSLMVRKDSQSSYVKIDDEMYEAAKATVIQQSRSKSEQRRKEKEEKDLLQGDEEDGVQMDLGEGTSTQSKQDSTS